MDTLYYVYDPMCSWCWAYQEIFEQIQKGLQQRELKVQKLLGGLAADTDEPMPEAMQKQLQATWKKIEKQTSTPFNYDFWSDCEPRRSTYPACRAVIAAGLQQAEAAMIDAIQRAYYLRAMNPSDEDTLLQLADELDLNFEQFAQDLTSAATQTALLKQVQLAQNMPINGFPSWVLAHKNQYHPVALDYQSASTTLAMLSDLLRQ